MRLFRREKPLCMEFHGYSSGKSALWGGRIFPLASRVVVAYTIAVVCGVVFSGCHHAASGTADAVYVAVKEAWLRDRIAPVSSKVAPVTNGEKLKVLDRERRFLQVQTPDNKTGWIEEHFVIDQPTYNAFQSLSRDHAKDPVVATGVLRDELFAHISPGRDTERFFLLPEGDKLQLLERASVKKLTPEETYREQQRKAAEQRAGAAADRLMELIQKGKGPTPKGPIELGKSRGAIASAGGRLCSHTAASGPQRASAAIRGLVASARRSRPGGLAAGTPPGCGCAG